MNYLILIVLLAILFSACQSNHLLTESNGTQDTDSNNIRSDSDEQIDPIYSILVNPSIYYVTAEHITAEVTNISHVNRGFGAGYRIEKYTNGRWEAIPLIFDVMAIAWGLDAGQTITLRFSLHQDQFNYQPGTYRVVLVDALGEPSGQFTLIR